MVDGVPQIDPDYEEKQAEKRELSNKLKQDLLGNLQNLFD